nr:putative GPI inositol-deacylase PGAP1-like, Alpha/Beta hydrolase fold protein [Ipomoea batatas]GMC60185.1 putative GPI inositol-deacylase PGAP1-like, Alpha/Beta hydrolase fold protein [Ipomoea batatas]
MPWTTARQLGYHGGLLRQDGDARQDRFFVHGMAAVAMDKKPWYLGCHCSQTEQAPLSAILWLHPTDMHGFRFLTISVAPRQTVLGRPPPPASMGVGQLFFNPDEGRIEVSPQSVIPMI